MSEEMKTQEQRLTQSDVGCATTTTSLDLIPSPPILSRSKTIDNSNLRSNSIYNNFIFEYILFYIMCVTYFS